jgi:RecB family exonuclease
VWWRFEKPGWTLALHQWLEGELLRQSMSDALPMFFEWSFGMPLRPGCDGASTEQPLLLGREGPQVSLQGKVDRIDSGGGRYCVIDYKTGRAPTRKQVEQGLRLQVPVYMMAVEALLDGAAELSGAGGYLPVGRTGPALDLPGKKTSCAELFAATEKYVTGYAASIRAGLFPVRPARECPDYCAARSYCRLSGDTENDGAEETEDE